MFAQLGDIKFELITYFNGWDETVSYNYVQHDRIENKPVALVGFPVNGLITWKFKT